MHQTLPWLPCFRFSKGIIIIQTFKISATDIPCRGAAHTFPSSTTIPCLICNSTVSLSCHADKYLLAQLMAPHHPQRCPECFVSFKIFHISNVRNDIFYSKKYHHTDIQFSMYKSAVITSLPKHTHIRMYFGRLTSIPTIK